MLNRILNMMGIVIILCLVVLTGCGNSGSGPDNDQWNTPTFWKTATADDVKNGIKAGYDANLIFSNGRTPLIMAALLNSSPETIEELIKAGASLKVSGGISPLMAAASSNVNPEVVKVLLKHGAEVNAKGINGISPILMAADTSPGDKVFELLVEAGADLNDRLDSGASVNDLAMKNHRGGALIRAYLAGRGVKIDTESATAVDEFVIQCTRGNLSRFKEMLDAGISLNKADSNGVLPLSAVVAAGNFDLEKFQMLLDKGALPNQDDKCHEAPLVEFFKHVYGEEVLYFYNEYYRERIKIEEIKSTVFHAGPIYKEQFTASGTADCANDSFFAVLKLFKKYNADFAVCDRFGNNLMHLAIMGRADDKVIRYLKSQGIDFNFQNKLGDTPDEMLIMPSRAEKE